MQHMTDFSIKSEIAYKVYVLLKTGFSESVLTLKNDEAQVDKMD